MKKYKTGCLLIIVFTAFILRNWLMDCLSTPAVLGRRMFLLRLFVLLASFLVLAAGLFVKIKVKCSILLEEGIAVCVSAIGYIVIEMAGGNAGQLSIWGFIRNGLLIYIFICTLWMIGKSVKAAGIITLILSFVIGTINHYVIIFKGNPVLPWDLYGIRTAAAVVSGYEYTGSFALFICFVITAVSIELISAVTYIENKEKTEKRFVNLSKGILLGCFYCFVIEGTLQNDIWDIYDIYKNQGFAASFYSYTKLITYRKPEGYSKEKCIDVINNEKTLKSEEKQKASNIIVVMNESFADLRIIGNKDFAGDYMPFFDSLRKDAVYGNLYVPVLGGGTANTEFEFLTGLSCVYTEGTPYEMYVRKDMHSLADVLKRKAFHTFAFHPYEKENWNRNNVYSRFGFEQFYSLEDMEAPEYLRWCVSDVSDYRYLIENYEQNKEQKYFMFNVTMQNHGGYEQEYDNCAKTVDLSQFGECPSAETYFTCIKQSDQALKELVNYFSSIEEPTVICFFGDHQPAVEAEFYTNLFGKSLNDLNAQEKQKRYITPFLIWANYDIQERYIDKISANFLMPVLLKTAGYDLEGFEAFLYRTYLDYPVISTTGIWNSEGIFYSSINQLEDERLNAYKMLQYYLLQGN